VQRWFSLFFLLLLSPLPPAEAIEADALMGQIDRLWRGNTSQATLSMEVRTRHYTRTMKMDVWSKGQTHSLLIIREPKKDQGIATLKAGKKIWNYLPKINRTTRIPASMMAGRWMGSHFTHDDLVKESQYQEDYESHLTFEGERDGTLLYEVTSIPKADAAIVWGKVVTEILQISLMPLKATYFDEAGASVRTLYFDQLREIEGRTLPMRLRVIPKDKPNESTTILYQQIHFDQPLTEQHFSLRSLKQPH
jgi:hypothetical protein